MKLKAVASLCCMAVLGLSVTFGWADEGDDAAPRKKPRKSAKEIQKKVEQNKKKKVPLAKQVDINTATKAELKRLPAITDELADKIIAGRPYASKAWLVTKNIIPATNYDAIHHLIAAKNPQEALKKIQQQGAQKK